ncbi:ABC transporter permease [Planctomycetales bacterium]|nr:ABC transporter permease [Planctomycetales bacterium]
MNLFITKTMRYLATAWAAVKKLRRVKLWWVPLTIGIAILLELLLSNHDSQPATKYAYYRYLLFIALAFSLTLAVGTKFFPRRREKLLHLSAFYTAVFLALNVYHLATQKFGLLPALFFPSPGRIIEALVVDCRYLIVDCLGSSAKLLAWGYFTGAIAGFFTGIAVGFNPTAAYWVNPLTRIIGPIPPTAWIPIVLVAFPTTFSGGAFLIALSVWFPVAVMTGSGIANVPNAYFEVSSTLGASRWRQIFYVGIPAAMPSIFIGLFTGTCSSFITLMTAEMLGVKNGIGWYVNWQREMLSYANVYAGLIIIAITFYLLITLLFRLRDVVLVWQKGVIKW